MSEGGEAVAPVVSSDVREAVLAQRDELDRADATCVHLYARPRAIRALMEKALARGGEAAAKELAFECQLFESFGSAAGVTTPESAPQLATAEGLAYLRSRLASPSAIVRVLAARFLWLAARAEVKHSGKLASEAYLEWFSAAAERAVKHRTADWASQAVDVLSAGVGFSKESGQHAVQLELARTAIRFANRMAAVGMGGWVASCAESLVKLPKRLLKQCEVAALIETSQAEAEVAQTTGNFWLERALLEAGSRLRRAVGLPGSDAEDWARLAASHEREAAAAGSAMLAESAYSEAVHAYRMAQKPDEAQRVSSLLERSSERARSELGEVSSDFKISTKVVEDFIRPFERRSIPDALKLLAIHPGLRMDPDRIAGANAKLAKSAPFHALVPWKLLGPEETFFAPRTDEGQSVLRFQQAALQWLSLNSQLFLVEILRRLRRRGLNEQHLLEHCFVSNIFEGADRPVLARGVRHWLAGDNLSALHLLVPTLERVLRRMCRKVGVPTIAVKEDGAEQISINAVLEHLKPQLEPSLWLELSIALVEKGGWSMRHFIAHGLAEADYFDASKVACVLHLYLMIGALRVEPLAAASARERATTQDESTG